MTLTVFDTLRGQLIPFKPIDDGKVGIYVCGPTVYDLPHIGHARTLVIFDMIARYLTYRGYQINYIVNITDIDDKIITRAQESSEIPSDLARKFERIFLEDMKTLNNTLVDVYPRVTDNIPDIIKIILGLIEKGYAYQIDDDVYFDVTKSSGLGKLSNQSLENVWAGARVKIDERKRNPADFALWKSSKKDEPFWESPFGKGRPGWHIECSAISMKYLGEQFDIHGGGRDLIFPHHENEIAQSEAYTGIIPVVRYWLHTGFLTIDGVKMSKSLGNFITVRNLLKNYNVNAFRLFIISTHYRSPIDYSEKGLKQSSKSLKRIFEALDNLRQGILVGDQGKEENKDEKVTAEVTTIHQRFLKAMDTDFNTPQASSEFFKLIKLGNQAFSMKVNTVLLQTIYDLIIELGSVFGLELERSHKLTDEEKKHIAERNIARKNKEWKKADEIREKLKKSGIILKDYPQGTLWTVERNEKT
ncbi:cysteine--tRNA ligase [Candidatus Bathyarchaeota archaeon]|nr:MAG: cysteine--tRNA ligase [Candidatus Bathyarchaeota archaeon]